MFNIEQVEILLESRFEELTEAQIEFLVENRIEFIKTSNRDSIPRDHDPESVKLSTDKIVDHIATKIDPSKNKGNTQWLVNRYKAGDFKISDAKNVKKVMDSFAESKKHLEVQDIGGYKSISHLKDALAPVQNKVDTEKERALKDKKESDSNASLDSATEQHGMPVVFRENGHVGFKVPNRARSIRNYGPSGVLAQSAWCTASNSKHNMFDGYSGGKYTLHLNDGNILQMHHQTDQLKNVKNYQINLKTDPDFSKHADVIKKFASVTHELEGKPPSKLVAPIPTDSEQMESLISEYDSHREKIKNVLANPKTDYFQLQLDNSVLRTGRQHVDKIKDAIKTSALTDSQFDRLSNFEAIDNTGYSGERDLKHHDFTPFAAYSPHAKPEHLAKIASGINMAQDVRVGSGNNTLSELLRNPNHDIKSHHAVVDAILSRGDKETALAYAQTSHNALPEHIDRLMHHNPIGITSSAISNPNFTPNESYFETLKDNPPSYTNMAKHPNLPAHIAQHILDNSDDNKLALTGLAANHAIPFDIAKAAYMKSGKNVRKLIEHPQSTKEGVSEIIKHHLESPGMSTGTLDWLESPRIGKDLLSHIVQHPNAHSLLNENGFSLGDSLNLKPSHLESLIASPNFRADSKDHVGAILRSHALNSGVVEKLIQKTGVSKELSDKLLSPNTNTAHVSANALHAVLDSADSSITHKQKVLFHPSTQLSHFNKLKDDIRLHGAISNSPNAPPSILHSLATSPMDHVRLNVANNPNTEKRTHDILKTDRDSEIAKISSKKATK